LPCAIPIPNDQDRFIEIEGATPAFDALLHVGTVLATICFYHKRIIDILSGSLQWSLDRVRGNSSSEAHPQDSIRLLGLICLSAGITGALGLPLKDLFESLFENTTAVGIAFLLTGLLLWVTRSYQTKEEGIGRTRVTLWIAVGVGLAQFLAITPGISRSGATIGIALVFGLERKRAAEFSFLISIPAILGANLVKLLEEGLPTHLGAVVIGVGSAFLIGLAALRFLIFLVKKGNFYQFAYYLIPLGLVVIVTTLMGWL